MNRKLIKIVSIFMVIMMGLSFGQSAFAYARELNINTMESNSIGDLKNAKYIFQNLSPEAKSLFLEQIDKDKRLQNFHKEFIDNDYTHENKTMNYYNQKRQKNYVSNKLYYAHISSVDSLDLLRSELKVLKLSTPVYYAFVGLGSSIAAAIGDGPLPVGDIVAVGAGLITGIVTILYWDEIEDNWDGIVQAFEVAFSSVAGSIEDIFNDLFDKSEDEAKELEEEYPFVGGTALKLRINRDRSKKPFFLAT